MHAMGAPEWGGAMGAENPLKSSPLVENGSYERMHPKVDQCDVCEDVLNMCSLNVGKLKVLS